MHSIIDNRYTICVLNLYNDGSGAVEISSYMNKDRHAASCAAIISHFFDKGKMSMGQLFPVFWILYLNIYRFII